MKIVINNCFGGFGLSEAGMRAYWGRKGKEVYRVGESGLFTSYFDAPLPPQFQLPKEHFMKRDHPEHENYNKWYEEHRLYDRDIPRDDSDLIAVVEELGSEKASGQCAKLKIVEIPDDADWEISEYDGNEHVAEKHRTWG